MIDEKASEAIRLTLEWDERRGYLMPYAVRDKLRLAYESAKQKGEAERWVLVPKEPTEAMFHASRGKCDAHGFNHETQKPCLTYETVRDLYRAMLSAGGVG